MRAFCPTLFWLFSGLTIPLALQSPAGWSFPALFALGTGLPLRAVSAAVAVGLGVADTMAEGLAGTHRHLRRVAGLVVLGAGLHDPFVYWWL